MKPEPQTILTPDDGNCLAACVATILELPLEVVPHFARESTNDSWFKNVDKWCRRFNLGFLAVDAQSDQSLHYLCNKTYCIVCGKTSEGNQHAVV